MCGGVGWVTFLTLLGYEIGSIPFVRRNFDKAILLIIFVSLLPTFIEFWKARRADCQAALVEVLRSVRMELAIRIQVEELPEGLFLATSDELPGLVAQGRTVAEALDIARDVARKLIEARRERDGVPDLPTTSERRDYTIVIAA